MVNALLPLLKDENFWVRSSVADALGQLGNAQNSISIPKHITIALDRWIEQNRESKYVSDGVRALWDIVSGETR